MSDLDPAQESPASERVSAEREGAASVAPESGMRVELDGESPRRRSSIRPVPSDWQPPKRSDPPPRPMVVVYAGDSQAPIDWDVPASETPNTARATPAELFTIPRDAPPPAIAEFEALAPPLDEGAHEPWPEAREDEPERVNIFDGRPISALSPEEVEALVAYELARDRFRAELETPAAPRVRASEPPAVPAAPAEPLPGAAELERAPEPARKLGVWPLVGGGLFLGVALAVVLSLGSRRTPAIDAARTESSPPTREATQSFAPPASETNQAGPTTAPRPSPPPAPSAVTTAELDPKRRSTKVVLEVFPFDAKVAVRGARRRGPPYEFDVPRGRRVVLEVSRKGYVPRKVVLDGSQASLTIGLTKDKASAASATVAPPTQIGVRSGL